MTTIPQKTVFTKPVTGLTTTPTPSPTMSGPQLQAWLQQSSNELKETQDGIIDFMNQAFATPATDAATAAWQALSGLNAYKADTKNKYFSENIAYTSKLMRKLDNGENGTIVFLGDSTTEANITNNNNPHVKMIETYLKNKYGTDKVTVINSGVSGQDIGQMWERCYKDVTKYNPDLVVISSGFNDVGHNVTNEGYEDNLRGVIEEILAVCGGDTDICLRTQNLQTDPNSTTMYKFEHDLNPIIKKLCNIYNLGFIDYYTYEKELYQNGLIDLSTINYDYTHPNEQGHTLIYNFMLPLFQPNATAKSRQVNNIKYIGYGSNQIVSNPATDFGVETSDYYVTGKMFSSYGTAGKINKIKFYGTGLSIIISKINAAGMLKITLDGTVIETAYDPYQSITKWRSAYRITGLAEAEHIVTVETTTQKNPLASANNVFLQGYFVYGNNTKQSLIDEKIYTSNITKDYCQLRNSANIPLPTGTDTKIAINTVVSDDLSLFDSANNRIVIKNSGIYMIRTNVSFDAGTGNVKIDIRKNTSTFSYKTDTLIADNNLACELTAIVQLDKLDLVEIYATQYSGSSKNIVAVGTYSPMITLIRLV